jgi:uncharacterized membrane protein YkvA (DUF1232 family)
MLERLKTWAAALKREALVLWFGSRDPRTPWYAKWLAAFIVAYALSPIDLIPDFIPIIGFLDEIILLPGAIWLVAHRPKPRNRIAAAAIVLLWILALWAIWAWLIRPRFFR